ncbi:hypothetical membrane protein [Thermococcus kodakarensis KOD1]|uniref:Hypothetical membrane protein n=1 Tax=Thermococcus kodakarensis (strain ATCC BAA-918 / JCM 12380 / KOD1) TaxID=69014 RepID=Q5JEZ5_THEKO|nr:rhomboid family intramembrane serine protease [Thermococcus kodakarensis]WCN28713.1 rhomboid family intramembrane serine protease [Thermococcus kodakarensis]WCN31011.1 rhomboid family intramembrane serine protease [Thermococcus kodakarensis]BAD84869.1 hypothetical membrane protein [Thermococcus kodakarensis KOD1]
MNTTKERVLFASVCVGTASVLLLLYLAPASIKEQLVMNYQEFSFSNPHDWIRLYTLHFVHMEFWHLAGNLLTFILLFPILYFLSEVGRSTDAFKRFTVFLFLVIPPIIGILDLLVMRRYNLRYGMGFSGIDSALLGALPYFSSLALQERFRLKVSPTMFSYAFTLLLGGLIALIYSIIWPAVLLIIGGGLFLIYLISQALRDSNVQDPHQKKAVWNFVLAIIIIMVGGIIGLFPSVIVWRSGLVNIFVHYVGLASTLYGFPILEEILKNKRKRRTTN